MFKVKEVKGNDVITTITTGGVLTNKKSMNFPGKVLNHAFLSEQDKSDLLFGIENDIDFVAASFVSNKQDALDLRNFLNESTISLILPVGKSTLPIPLLNIKSPEKIILSSLK